MGVLYWGGSLPHTAEVGKIAHARGGFTDALGLSPGQRSSRTHVWGHFFPIGTGAGNLETRSAGNLYRLTGFVTTRPG